jgi:hypothetical protein
VKSNWAKLSETLPGIRHPEFCQCCNKDNRVDLESDLTIWCEHDDQDNQSYARVRRGITSNTRGVTASSVKLFYVLLFSDFDFARRECLCKNCETRASRPLENRLQLERRNKSGYLFSRFQLGFWLQFFRAFFCSCRLELRGSAWVSIAAPWFGCNLWFTHGFLLVGHPRVCGERLPSPVVGEGNFGLIN